MHERNNRDAVIYTLDEICDRVAPIIRKYRIPAMYLFGSYARGEATAESDLDFLIDTTGTELTSLLRLGALCGDLEEIFQKRIDVVTIRAIMQPSDAPNDVAFRNTVLKERVRIDDAI